MEIIKKPIVTEKMTKDSETFNRYGFVVDPRANKLQIKKAVEEMYDVTVDNIRTMNYAGKATLRMTKAGIISGKKNSFKKAIVTLVDGDAIDFYSNI